MLRSTCFKFDDGRVSLISHPVDGAMSVDVNELTQTLRQIFSESSEHPRLIAFPGGELERSMSFGGNAIFGRARGFFDNRVSFAARSALGCAENKQIYSVEHIMLLLEGSEREVLTADFEILGHLASTLVFNRDIHSFNSNVFCALELHDNLLPGEVVVSVLASGVVYGY